MNSKKVHQKHAKLSRPATGNFARNEFAFVGAPCGLIQEVAKSLIPHFLPQKVTYIDADHAFGDEEQASLCFNELTDKITFFRFDKKGLNDFDQKIILNDQDLVLVNGNHFQAKSQVVFIHPKKEESLKKRLSQLTNIVAYILCEGCEKVFEWLEVCAPIFYENQVQSLIPILKENMAKTPVKGLILAGGKSLRMGEDKGQLNYHGDAQVDYLLSQMKEIGLDTYVSCREDQYQDLPRITDKFVGLGPFGAIATAFQQDPNSAWLVVACDLPFVDKTVFETLLKERDESKYATCFYNKETDFPDPLITIWEPKAYMRLMEFLAMGYSCPRKVLINSDIKMVNPENGDILKNVNTKEEYQEIIKNIN